MAAESGAPELGAFFFFFTWAKSRVYFWVEGEQSKKLEAKSLRWRGTEDEKEFENVSQWL